MDLNELLKQQREIENSIKQAKNEQHEKNLADIIELKIKENMSENEIINLIENTIKWTLDIERKKS